MIALLALLGVPHVGGAQVSATDLIQAKWNALYQDAVKKLEGTAKSLQAEVPPVFLNAVSDRDVVTRQNSVSAAADAVDSDSASAAVRRLAGAIKTHPDGTQAGLVIAPFVLAGSRSLPGLELTLGTLKEDLTRAGASYTWDMSPSLGDIWEPPASCAVTADRLEQLEAPKHFFTTACADFVAAISKDVKEADKVRLACGVLTPSPGQPPVNSLEEAVELLSRAVRSAQRMSVAEAGASVSLEARERALALAPVLTDLGDWRAPTDTSCYSDADVAGHFQLLYWKNPTKKFAIAANWDLFPLVLGFSPDGSRLARGEVRSRELRADFSRTKGGTEVGGGVGLGRARIAFTDTLTPTMSISASIAHATTLLRSKPLRRNGDLRLYDGELPPRLVVGVFGSVEFSRDKPASQDTAVNEIRIQPHLDFFITDKLTFRLGLPIRAEIAERREKAAVSATESAPAMPAVTAQRKLQWTVPASLVAVLKL